MKDVENARKLLDADSLSIQTKNGVRTIPITVLPHPTKGFLTGVITVPNLSDVEDEDILEELRDQGVQRVRRLQRRENGGAVKSDTFVLSFSQNELPEKVRVTWRSIRVRPYIPNPVRCYRCQGYGHVASSCGRTERCARCSATGHKSSSCTAPKPRCTCGGEHEAWSRECPKLAKEKQKVRERLSGSTKRTETRPRTDDTIAPPRRQLQHTPEPTPYRNALLEDAVPPQTNHMPCPPPPAFTLETKVQDCMQLSLQQLLALLGDHSCTAQPCKVTSTSTRTRDIGIQCHIPETAEIGAQTDPTAHQSVPLLEEGIHREVAVVVDGGTNETPTDGSSKRSREDSPIQPPASGPTPSPSAGMDDADVHPQEIPTTPKRARVARNHIEHPSEPATLPAGTTMQIPAASLSTQSRDRQRISWSDDPTLMKPPPPPPRPPPISGRLGSVPSVSFFSPTQSPSEMTKPSDAPVRSRSAQRTSPQTPRKRLGFGSPMSIFSPAQSASQLSSGRSSSAQRAGPWSGNSAAGDGLFGRRSSFSSDA